MENKFFVLSKKVNDNMYNKYKKILSNITFISDTYPTIMNDDIIYYPDDEKFINLGYCNMHSSIKITSWDKVFYYLKHITLKENTYYWIIEDDVFINKDKFKNLVYSLNNYYYDLCVLCEYLMINNNIYFDTLLQKNHHNESKNMLSILDLNLLILKNLIHILIQRIL